MPQHEFDEDNLMMIMNVIKIIIILAPGYDSFKITIIVIKVQQKPMVLCNEQEYEHDKRAR